MTILWMGGEDIDFTDTVNVTTTSANFRSGYARCGIDTALSGMSRSVAFPGGAISSGWVGAQVGVTPQVANRRYFGLGNIAQSRALIVGTNASTAKLALFKLDGTTFTELASEAGTSVPSAITKFDLNLIALGVSGSAAVYINGTLILSYSGDLSWLNNPDCVGIVGSTASAIWVSEIVVADEDTRLFSLVTQAPNAVGDANAWTGAFTDINETTMNDSTILFTNTITQDAIFNLIDLPSGTFTIRGVRVAARAAKSASATAGSISLGVKTGGTVNVDTAHACATSFATIDRLMTQNPVTTNNWLQSEMNSLQVAFRSAT